MTVTQIWIMDDGPDITRAAAELVASLSREPVMARGRFNFALSGGGTPVPLYRLLGSPAYALALPWERTHFFWCDERCVPPDHAESSYGQARATLLQPIDAAASHVHRIRGELDPTAAAVDYTTTLRLHADEGLPWPQIDLAILGLGADGHTASLFPQTTLEPEDPNVPARAVTGDYDNRPSQRVTLMPTVFRTARHLVFLVTGANKADALAATLEGPHDPARWPAQRLQPEGGTVTWIVDRAAGARLQAIRRGAPTTSPLRGA
ncbi:MAG: 6-phosphogluconolactonase [Anaerolineales bacterium]|nr:6-phosphogluconolactonase [Anaerolineales bacterium]